MYYACKVSLAQSYLIVIDRGKWTNTAQMYIYLRSYDV